MKKYLLFFCIVNTLLTASLFKPELPPMGEQKETVLGFISSIDQAAAATNPDIVLSNWQKPFWCSAVTNKKDIQRVLTNLTAAGLRLKPLQQQYLYITNSYFKKRKNIIWEGFLLFPRKKYILLFRLGCSCRRKAYRYRFFDLELVVNKNLPYPQHYFRMIQQALARKLKKKHAKIKTDQLKLARPPSADQSLVSFTVNYAGGLFRILFKNKGSYYLCQSIKQK
ncbi:MAG TPA: hypothetical protein VKS21_04950 [Spirochaetota bacterium]|nr:hypothetical protein [Spirochaetota bacterium]